MKRIALSLGIALFAVAAQAAEDVKSYPLRPVRLINPFPPGGSSDPSCRLLADALTKALGQQFVVDNRGGGSTSAGADRRHQ